MLNNTDREWEKYGKIDPYFGVISHTKYKKDNLTDTLKEEFFQSGYADIEHIVKQLKKHIDPSFKIKNALDFGCGVGRLLIPIAEIAESVTGVDISESMLQEARKNCEFRSIKNVDLAGSIDELASAENRYNFIHSSIVFQHIPVKRGETIFKQLFGLLAPGGCCVVHFTYSRDHKISILASWLKKYIPLGKNLLNIFKKKPFFYPTMQMNSYNLNNLNLIIQKENISECFTEYTDHGGDLGVLFYFKKPENG